LAKKWQNHIHLVLLPSQELLESFEIPDAVSKTKTFINQIKHKVDYLGRKEDGARLIRFVLKELLWLCDNVESQSLEALHAKVTKQVGFLTEVSDFYEQYLATEQVRQSLVARLPILLSPERGEKLGRIPRWQKVLQDGLVQTPKLLKSLN
jgi:hypothetical protein